MFKFSFSELLKNFWIFQAFQVPLVFSVIILLIIVTRTNTKYGTGQLGEVKIPGIRLLALGFAFNFLYLVVNLTGDLKIVSFNDVRVPILVLDILTTICFSGVVFRGFFIEGLKIYRGREPFSSRKLILVLVASLVFGVGCYVFYSNYKLIQNGPLTASFRFNGWLFGFDFLCYFLLGIYLFKAMGSYRPVIGGYSRVYLLIGFLIWAALHPFAFFLKIETPIVNLFGFASSTVAKVTILCGLVSYFLNTARAAILKRNIELEKNSADLEYLRNINNEIVSQNSIADLESSLERHLMRSPLFHFDYMHFFKVDHLKKKADHA